MSIGCFIEKKRRPTAEEIDRALGVRRDDWLALLQFIRERFSDHEEWKFMYGKRYGWALHMRSGKKMVTNLFPTEGGFTVQINLSEAEVQEAFKTDLCPEVRQVMAASHPFPEGRWMWIPASSERSLEDIRSLLVRRMKMLANKG
jgi:hypothetical protein